jgi:hypothetical protein
MPTVDQALTDFYETRCQSHGLAFSELFAMAVRLTGWPLPIAFSVTAHLFSFEFELFCCRSLAGSARPNYADRWHITPRPDLN